uniref:Vacuolar ATP synthase subunit G n=1 Tax=Arundo donax TaxID=35708 RepID=A0A0A9D8D7_ARUDO
MMSCRALPPTAPTSRRTSPPRSSPSRALALRRRPRGRLLGRPLPPPPPPSQPGARHATTATTRTMAKWVRSVTTLSALGRCFGRASVGRCRSWAKDALDAGGWAMVGGSDG